MSTYVLIRSICGEGGSFVDTFDVPLNPEGVICCRNCESILLCREAWYEVYDGVSI